MIIVYGMILVSMNLENMIMKVGQMNMKCYRVKNYLVTIKGDRYSKEKTLTFENLS